MSLHLNNDTLVAYQVLQELREIRKHFRPFQTAHEGIGVLWEEFEELKEEVWKKRKDRDLERMRREAVQVAAVAIRFAADLAMVAIPDDELKSLRGRLLDRDAAQKTAMQALERVIRLQDDLQEAHRKLEEGETLRARIERNREDLAAALVTGLPADQIVAILHENKANVNHAEVEAWATAEIPF